MSTILVVDDVADVRLLLQMSLSVEGYDLVTANDGQQALAMIESTSPDLVLLDVMMPVLDGWGVLDALDHTKAPPIIVFSGFANHDRSPVVMALEKGAIDFLSKPFDMDHLLRVVQRVLAKTRDELEAERQSRLQTL